MQSYINTVSSIVNDLHQANETVSDEEHRPTSWLLNGVVGNRKFIAAEASIAAVLHVGGANVSTVHNILLHQKVLSSFERPKYLKAPSTYITASSRPSSGNRPNNNYSPVRCYWCKKVVISQNVVLHIWKTRLSVRSVINIDM